MGKNARLMIYSELMGKNTNNGRIAQKKGREAELRVQEFCQILGLETCTSPELDYGGKTDCLIEGRRVQVSCQPKSKQTLKALQKKDIYNIYAGEQVEDEHLQDQIIEAMDSYPEFPLS